MTPEDYINDKQNVIDSFLKHKNKEGYCIVDIEDIAKDLEKSKKTIKNKIEQINEIDNVIEYIGLDKVLYKEKYKINIEQFRKTKHALNIMLIYQKFKSDITTMKINEKELANDLNVRVTDIKRAKAIIYSNRKELIE